jgi:tRNA threonylcarbamoyladenosine modification (KEOPS) complex  Pcc1 subunit
MEIKRERGGTENETQTHISGISLCRKAKVMDLQIEAKRVSAKRATLHYESQ